MGFGFIGFVDGFDMDVGKKRNIRMIYGFLIWGIKMVVELFSDTKKVKKGEDLVVMWIKNCNLVELNLIF